MFCQAVRGTNESPEILEAALDALHQVTSGTNAGKRQVALEIARDSQLRLAAGVQFRLDALAPTSVMSYSSEVALYVDVCSSATMVPWPVSVRSLELFASTLKAAGYRGANSYLSAVLTCQRMMGREVSDEVMCARSRAAKTLARGLGDPHRVEAVTVQNLVDVKDWLEGHLPAAQDDDWGFSILVFRLCVVGMFFMLRVEELLQLRQQDVLRCTGPQGEVELVLTWGKTNPGETVVRRKLKCVCAPCQIEGRGVVQVCPVCSVHALGNGGASMGTAFLSQGVKHRALGYSGFLMRLRMLLGAVGCEMRTACGAQRYGTHSLRRGGAQALARANWPVDAIQRWGRWESDVVFAYVQDVIFEATWPSVASSIVGFEFQGHYKEHKGQQVQVFRGRRPVLGDRVTVRSEMHQRWLVGRVVLTPAQTCPRHLRVAVSTWPVGQNVFLLEFENVYKGGKFISPFSLDAGEQWCFCGTESLPLTSRSGRVVKRPRMSLGP